MHINIPPARWATGGLAVLPGKLPLTLLSARALDQAPLEVSRAHIASAKVYELNREAEVTNRTRPGQMGQTVWKYTG